MSTEVQNTISVSSATELMAALETAQGGETILLAAGSYGELDLYDARHDFVKYASEVTVKSADPDSLASFARMSLTGVENLTFDTIHFDYEAAPGTAEHDKPFIIRDSASVTVRNSIFDGDLAEGISATADGFGTGHGLTVTDGSSNISIYNNEFQNWMRGAVFTSVDNLVVTGNDVHSVRSDGFDFANVNDVLIEGNHLHDFLGAEGTTDHMDMIQFWTSGTSSPSTNITIRQNILDSGAGNYTQSIFMRNEAVDSYGGGLDMFYQNILIEDNVIHNAHTHGITVGETVGLTVQNNTILHNADSGDSGLVNVPTINVSDASQNVLIASNILPRFNLETAFDRVVENNLVVQTDNPAGDNYVGDLFVNALSGSSATLDDLKAVPGGLVEAVEVGSSLTRFDTTPETTTGFIASSAGTGLASLTHNLDASQIFDASGGVDVTGAEVAWDFGDGAVGTGLTGSYSWQQAGTYDVTADVTLADGEIVSLRKTVEVQTPLAIHANFDTGAEDLSDVSNGVVVGSAVTFEGEADDKALRLNDGLVSYKRSNELINNDEYTLQVDFRKDAGGEGESGVLVYFSYSFIVDIGADSMKVMVGTDQGNTWLKPTSVGVNDSDWHRLALTFSGTDGSAILYLDGAEVARLSGLEGAVQTGSASHDLHLGSPFDSTSAFPGLIDNFQFWKGAMSAEQVASLGTRGEDGKFAPLADSTEHDGHSEPAPEPIDDGTTDDGTTDDGTTDDGTTDDGTTDDGTTDDGTTDDGTTDDGTTDDGTTGDGTSEPATEDDTFGFDDSAFDQVIVGTDGGDRLSGGNGSDHIDGGAGDDSLSGKNGDDLLIGGSGDDELAGGGGNDVLVGGPGNDMLIGGPGSDTFTFTAIADSPIGSATDSIKDFTPGEDKIDVSRMDAVLGDGSDPFVFIGTDAFSAAGQLRVSHYGRSSVVEANVDADDGADFRISLMTPNLVLTADDFVA